MRLESLCICGFAKVERNVTPIKRNVTPMMKNVTPMAAERNPDGFTALSTGLADSHFCYALSFHQR